MGGHPADHGVHPFKALWTHPVPDLQESAVQRFPSSQLRAVPAEQTPNWQVSVPLHTFPSLHEVPLGTGAYTHPVGGLQLSAVHGLPSSHLRGLPLQTPPEQVSPVVQALPSLQALPLIFTGFEHVPVLGSQVPTTLHWSEAVQTTWLLPLHTPLWQVSVCVQALPSLQALPLAFAGFEHVPVAGLQVPEVGRASGRERAKISVVAESLKKKGAGCLQALPSLQALPLAFAGFEHVKVDGLQVPAMWQWSEAVQSRGLLPVHTPLWQVSVCVQALPSLQVLPLAFAGFEHVPVVGLQVPAVWHWAAEGRAVGEGCGSRRSPEDLK